MSLTVGDNADTGEGCNKECLKSYISGYHDYIGGGGCSHNYRTKEPRYGIGKACGAIGWDICCKGAILGPMYFSLHLHVGPFTTGRLLS